MSGVSGPTRTLSIARTNQDTAMLAVSVRDSGVGIEDQDPHRIFRVLHEQDYRRG